MTDDDGAVVEDHAYGAYGDIEGSVSSLPPLAGQPVGQPHRFTGREWDPETGLLHYRARAYDPATGRFLQEDPIWFEAGDLNVYRYVWNNPGSWTDPTGLVGAVGGAGSRGTGTAAVGGMASAGQGAACLFGIAAGAVNVVRHVGAGGELTDFRTIGGEAAAAAGECTAVGKVLRKLKINRCKVNRVMRFITTVGGITAGRSFTADTPILTTEGYVPIQDIEPGIKVAAIEEQTGRVVWRTVLETYERVAPGVLQLTVEAADGTIETLTTTPEHPFHVEGWDGTVDALWADLGGDAPRTLAAANDDAVAGALYLADAPLAARTNDGTAPLDDHALARLFPTEGETAFGTWVKAGALKAGDAISTRGSVEGSVARDGAANDNAPLTLRSVERDDGAASVYNFAVQSLPGEVTHNYLVGDGEWWTHNAGKAHPVLTLYRMVDRTTRALLKHGVTHNEILDDRYSRRYLDLNNARCEIVQRGLRKQLLLHERFRIRINPGPLNRGRWAGKGIPDKCTFGPRSVC